MLARALKQENQIKRNQIGKEEKVFLLTETQSWIKKKKQKQNKLRIAIVYKVNTQN